MKHSKTAVASQVIRPRWTLAIVCVATFMLLLDVTIVTVALGDIQLDLNADLSSLQWVVDAYTVPLVGLLLTAATLGDRWGRRRVFLVGAALFTLGSLACALSWTPLVLDLTRALQGCGGALLLGTGLPLIAAAHPEPRRRAAAVGVYASTVAAGTAIGPLAGGLLVDAVGWRSIFLVNVPIGVLAVAAGRWRLTERREVSRSADWPGAVLLVASVTALLFGLIRGNDDGWGSPRIVALLCTAAVLFVAFVIREAVVAEPMLDLGLFRGLSFAGVVLAGWMISATVVAGSTYLSLYLFNTDGYGAMRTGLTFLPLTGAAFVAALVAARLFDRVPPRFTVGGSLAFAAVGLWWTGHLDGGGESPGFFAGLVLAGIGLGAASAATNQASLAVVHPSRAGMASGANLTMRQLGVAAGIAILGAVFQRRITTELGRVLAPAGLPAEQLGSFTDAVSAGSGPRAAAAAPARVRPVLVQAARAATVDAVNEVLLVAAVGAAVAAVVAFIVVRPAPSDL